MIFDEIKNFIDKNYYKIFAILLILILIIIFYKYNNNISFNNNIINNNMNSKYIVFDLDETLGCFFQLGTFIDGLESFYNKKLDQNEFNETLDIFQEFLRPNIVNILNFLIIQRDSKKLSKIYIFTNNQGDKSWSNRIANYFSYKLQKPCFNKIIGAWKVKGLINEPLRTSHNKKITDFHKITQTNSNSQICFIDDLYHPEMDNGRTFYINITPYYIILPINYMISKYINFNKNKNLFNSNFSQYMHNFLVNYKFRSYNFNNEYFKQNIKISNELFNDLNNYLDIKKIN